MHNFNMVVLHSSRVPLEWDAPAGLFETREHVIEMLAQIYRLDIWGRGADPMVARPWMLDLRDVLRNNAIGSVVDNGRRGWQFSQHIA
jgi:hypothetical protein